MSNEQIPARVPEDTYKLGDILGELEGYYVQLIESRAKDSGLISSASPHVTDTNAKEWLELIRDKSKPPSFPPWPASLNDLEAYVSTNPQIVNLLEDVRQKQAYAWLVKNVIAPPPPPPPSLRSIIFPTEPLFSANVDPGPPLDKHTSTKTHPFTPDTLDRNRVPVTIEPLAFIDHARLHLVELLTPRTDILDKPIESSHQVHLKDIKDNIKDYYTIEDNVKKFSIHMSTFVEGLYAELTGRHVQLETERPATNNVVCTDCIYIRDDQTVLLWENKSGQTLHKHWGILQSELVHGIIEHYNEQTSWESWAAIVGKLTWHASDKNNRLNWATVFSGRHFVVIFISWIEDSDHQQRPHLFCSPEYPMNNPSLPFSSALLYLLLAFDIDQKTLMNKFQLQVLAPPPVLRIRTGETSASEQDIQTGKSLCLVFDLPHLSPQPILPLHRRFEYPNDIISLPVLQLQYKEQITLSDPPITYRHVFPSVSGQYFVKVIGKISNQDTDLETYISRWVVEQKQSRNSELGATAIVEILGLYHGVGFDVVITASSGNSLISFDELAHDDKIWIYRGLLWLHCIHVKHGDFAPRNVVHKAGSRPVIIDFSHSALQHECLGSERCPELIEAQKMLQLSELHVQGRVSTPLSTWNTTKTITFQARLRWLHYFIAGLVAFSAVMYARS